MQMKPKARRGSLPRAAYATILPLFLVTFYGQFGHSPAVNPKDVSQIDAGFDRNLLPLLPEYVPPAQNLMVSRVRDLFEVGHDLGADGAADVDLSFQLLLGPDDPLDGPGAGSGRPRRRPAYRTSAASHGWRASPSGRPPAQAPAPAAGCPDTAAARRSSRHRSSVPPPMEYLHSTCSSGSSFMMASMGTVSPGFKSAKAPMGTVPPVSSVFHHGPPVLE